MFVLLCIDYQQIKALLFELRHPHQAPPPLSFILGVPMQSIPQEAYTTHLTFV